MNFRIHTLIYVIYFSRSDPSRHVELHRKVTSPMHQAGSPLGVPYGAVYRAECGSIGGSYNCIKVR